MGKSLSVCMGKHKLLSECSTECVYEILIKKWKTCTLFLLSCRNAMRSLGEHRKLWEHQLTDQQYYHSFF